VAVQDGVVLGALIGAKPDAASRPPRCLFVVRRVDGSLWAVDASRVEAPLDLQFSGITARLGKIGR
jgi:hypothetical protein